MRLYTHTHTHTSSFIENKGNKKLQNNKGKYSQGNLFIRIKGATTGITLVALVVAIVILLILAGITISYLMGDHSIFKLAQEAKDRTDNAIQKEIEDLGTIANQLKGEYGDNNGNGGTTNPPAPPEEDKTVADIVNKVQDTNKTVEDENGNKVTIPGGFKVVPNSPEGTDESEKVDYTYNGDGTPAVQDGIVIEDEEGNQFVWIPVGDIKNKDGSTTTITLGRYTFDRTNGTPTLQQNADNYTQIVTVFDVEENYYYQELTSNSGNTAAKNLGDFITKTKANGGYYLGRYEASKGSDNRVKSQADKVAWVDITQPNAATAAREMYSSSYVESDLINSYSWDSAIVFIQNYSGNTNYANKNSVNQAASNTGKAGDKVCNIHDMASNYWEWSTEHSTFTLANGEHPYPCVCRGGVAGGNPQITSVRVFTSTSASYSYDSFRPLCYLK